MVSWLKQIKFKDVQRCFVQRMFPEDAVNRELRKIGIREFCFEWPVRLLTSQDPHFRKRTAFWSNLLWTPELPNSKSELIAIIASEYASLARNLKFNYFINYSNPKPTIHLTYKFSRILDVDPDVSLTNEDRSLCGKICLPGRQIPVV